MINAQYYFQIIYNLVFTLKRYNQLNQKIKNDLEDMIRDFLVKYPTRKKGFSVNHSLNLFMNLKIIQALDIAGISNIRSADYYESDNS